MSTPEEVFKTATSFEHSAHLVSISIVERTGKRSFEIPIDQTPAGVIPMIVCFTFSVELYLKCLVWLERGTSTPRGHNLEHLFALVTLPNQSKIEHHFEAFLSQVPNRHDFESSDKVGFGKGSTEFGNALKVASDAFVNWRYVYERTMVAGPALSMHLAYAVRRTIIEERPKWESFLAGLSMPPTFLTR
jgi:hypothetical protein